ncbi:MAG: hypothetical protein HY204_09960 [Nitrospirae bacterium]|nr:hypothetical protein [Nitrospirota bacterium]
MKKLAAIFLTLLFASTASAQVISNPTTNARMDGLGVNNWQIEDDFNIWINPAQLSNYKNAIYGELGTYAGTGTSITPATNNDRTGAWGGLNMDVSYGGWGVYLGRPYAGPLKAMAAAGAGTAPTANRFDLFYAAHGTPLGFYLSYADFSTTNKTPVTNKDQASEIDLGVGGLLMGGMLDAALDLGIPSSKCSSTTDGSVGCNPAGAPTSVNAKGNAGMNYALLVRHHASAVGGTLLTTVRIGSVDASTKAGAVKTDNTTTNWSLDTALNSKPNPDTLVVAGIGIASSNNEIKTGSAKTTTDTMTIPVNLAVENQTFKKVQTRFGLFKNIYSTTETKIGTTKTTTVANGAAVVSAGLGWSVSDNLMVNAVINQDILFTGSYVVSGVPETLSSKLSATYRFK